MKLKRRLALLLATIMVVFGTVVPAFADANAQDTILIAPAPADPTVAKATTGTYQGKNTDGYLSWRSIAYATTKRWEKAVPAPKSSATIDCTGDSTVVFCQPRVAAGVETTEDYVTLDVYANATGKASGKPVLVQVNYGGGTSSNSNGANFAEVLAEYPDMVIVNLNMRTSYFGCINLAQFEGYSAVASKYQYSNNLARTDLVEGLKWVKENIAAFGGDPNNITLEGASGGAVTACTPAIIEGASQYFNKILMSSGVAMDAISVGTMQEAKNQTQELINFFKGEGGKMTIDEALALTAQDLNDAQAYLASKCIGAYYPGSQSKTFTNIADEIVIKSNYLDTLKAAAKNGVQIIAITSDGEYDSDLSKSRLGLKDDCTEAEYAAAALTAIVTANWGKLDPAQGGDANAAAMIQSYVDRGATIGRGTVLSYQDLKNDINQKCSAVMICELWEALGGDAYLVSYDYNATGARGAHAASLKSVLGKAEPVFGKTWRAAIMNFIANGNPNCAELKAAGIVWEKFTADAHQELVVNTTMKVQPISDVRWADINTLLPMFAEYPEIAKMLAAKNAEDLKAQQTAAEALADKGLIAGTDKGFALEKTTTREEAIVMLVKLLGAEEEAVAAKNACPFTDVAPWAADFVGYAKAKGLANGASATFFNAKSPITANEFATLLLRAVGKDVADYRDPWAEAVAAGLVEEAPAGLFTRGDMFEMANAMVNKYGVQQALDKVVVNPAKVPAVKTTTNNGTKFAWNPTRIFFKEGNADAVYLDFARYELINKLETKNGVTFIALDDLYRLYAPDFTVKVSGKDFTASHATVTAQGTLGSKTLLTYKGEAAMAAAPYANEDGVIYVPFIDFLTLGFGKTQSTATKLSKFNCISNDATGVITRDDTYTLERAYRTFEMIDEYKTYAGAHQFVFWFEDYEADGTKVERLVPTVVYIPSTYNPAKANKMIVQLHGAGGNAIQMGTSANGIALQEAAERYGYVVMFADSYASQCNFGQIVQPYGLFIVDPATVDVNNPANYAPGTVKDIAHSGESVQQSIKFVEDYYNIDKNNLFIMGISMGGCGTWYQVAAHPGMFNAASPSGAFVEAEYFDWSQIKTPTLYIGGTDDRNGFELMLKAYDIAMKQGANIKKFEVVGGAPHGGEWPQRIDMTLDFFESYLK
ncbi:MAG: carboxylesterase family protein [Clostridia bacterium]|nr:carboxylesterase family protein [Clostridia bacterium]